MSSEHKSKTPQIDSFAVIGSTIKLYKKYFPAVVVGGVLLAIITLVQSSFRDLWFVMSIIYAALTAVINVVFLQYVVRNEHKRTATIQSAAKQAVPYIVPGVLISLVTFSISLGGYLLLIIPGVIFSIMFSQSFNYVVLEKKSIGESLRLSRQLTKGNKYAIFRTYWLLYLPIFVVSGMLYLLLTRPFPEFYATFNNILTIFSGMLAPLLTYEIYLALNKLHSKEN